MLKLTLAPIDTPKAIQSIKSPILVERNAHKAWLHVPKVKPTGPVPLLVHLHGAGKDRMWSLKDHVDAWALHADKHGIAVLFPAALGSTWDFISSKQQSRKDFDFLEEAITIARRTVPIDDRRIALLGISDGGSMALSLASHNPGVFQAAMSISAGFCAQPPKATAGRSSKMFLKHGAKDDMFPLARVGLPLRETLVKLGYDVTHVVGQGEGGLFGPAGHVPPGWHEEFLPAWLAMLGE